MEYMKSLIRVLGPNTELLGLFILKITLVNWFGNVSDMTGGLRAQGQKRLKVRHKYTLP